MKKKPNILFVLMDQYRFDCLGGSGLTPVKTPNIDEFRKSALSFENAYTPLPVCSPARQSLLTGRWPDSFGALWNYGTASVHGLEKGTRTWVQSLAEEGYETVHIGQWHVSDRGGPTDFGYTKFVSPKIYSDYIAKKYPPYEYKNGWFGEPSPYPVEDAQSHFMTRLAIEEMRSAKGKPWHIFLDLPFPHLPCRPSSPFAEMYRSEDTIPWQSYGDTLENKPFCQRQQIRNWGLEGRTWEDWAPTVAYYYGMCSQLDDAFGLLIKELEEEGILEDTIVVLTSDHGDTSGGHGMMDKHYILYDDVTHIPFIIRYPKCFTPGKETRFVCNCLDFAPTLEEILELPSLPDEHGTSLLATIQGKNPEEFSVSSSNGQQFGAFTQRCIRTEDYKYIWNLTDTDELYDLKNDPGEKINRIDDPKMGTIMTELREKLYYALVRRKDPYAVEWVKGQLLGNTKGK